MGYNRNFINEINQLLIDKRNESDVSVTLNIPEHKFKKIAEKFNYALSTVYDRYKNEDVKMFHILLALHNYFELEKLVEEILNAKNKKIIKAELQLAYNVKASKRKTTKNPPNYQQSPDDAS